METGKEREISLYDMIWAICLKWRSILLVAIIFAVLAGGFSYVKSSQAEQPSSGTSAVTTAELYGKMSYEEQKISDVYLSYKQTYDEVVAYNENAPLMQLNANDFYKGEVSFYVDNQYVAEYPVLEKTDNTIALTNAYKGVLTSEDFAGRLTDILGVEKTSYALEMVDCEGVYAGTNVVENVEVEGIFSVCVYAADEETCAQMTEHVRESILAKKTELTKQFGKHEINVLQEGISQTSSNELLEQQKINMDMAYACSNNMYNMALRFTDTQKKYVDQVIAGVEILTEQKAEDAEQITVAAPTVSKKLVVLGFLGGAFLMFVLWALVYIFNTKLRLEDNFEQIFDCKSLGNVPIVVKKKKWFGFIDKLFGKLRHYNQRYFEEEDALDMIAANIRIAIQKTEGKKVMVTGAVCSEDEKKVAEALAKRLKKDGIEIVCESPILYNAESLEKLVETGCAVLVEKAEKSLYQEVAKEIEICAQQEVELLGTVVVY